MPSDNLIRILGELQLASPKVVAQCESSVKNLCHDLPDFDSVWLDALVQRSVLTAWQAQVLQGSEDAAGLLSAGDFVLQQPLGEQTFLGASRQNGRLAVLRRLPERSDSDHEEVLLTGWRALLDRLDGIRSGAPDSIELPRVWIDGEQSQFVASGFVPGYTLEELIIRGGRLPWQAVAEIGRQLLEAVAWLESCQLYHSHIVLRNIRLNAHGRMCLVNPFAHHMQSPYLSFRSDLKLDDIECTAPELVSSGRMVDSQSELYSVGCVLWNLLTGRSVFLSTDPVTRLSKAAERDVADARSIVPDCPDWMAEQLLAMTRRTPELRPESALVAARHWNARAPKGVPLSRRLLKQMPERDQTPQVAKRGKQPERWKAVVTVSAMLICFVGYSIHRGILPLPLQLTGAVPTDSESSDSDGSDEIAIREAPPTESDSDGLLMMPSPDAGGVVLLQSGRVYRAADIDYDGQLYIEATGDEPAIIRVADQSWIVDADQVSMSHLQIESDSDTNRPLLEAMCGNLQVNHTLWQSSGGCVSVRGTSGVESSVQFADSVFRGTGDGILLDRAVLSCAFRNCLATSTGAVVRVSHESGAFPVVRAERLTVSQSKSLLDIVVGDPDSVLTLQVECVESVFATSTATAGLIRIAGPENWRPDRLQVLFSPPIQGNGAIVSSAVNPVIYLDRSLRQMVALSEKQIENRSLMLVEPTFAAPSGSASPWAGFELTDFDGPKLSPQLPGVDISRLPIPVNPEMGATHKNSVMTGEE